MTVLDSVFYLAYSAVSSMTADSEWTLAELADESGVSPRTIRFYITRGLMPGPVTRGRNAGYTDGHLERLREIQQLQAEGLTLGQISQRLSGEDKPLTPPASLWSYAVAEDVTVLVNAGASPWRLNQIRVALAELTARLQERAEEEDT